MVKKIKHSVIIYHIILKKKNKDKILLFLKRNLWEYQHVSNKLGQEQPKTDFVKHSAKHCYVGK